MKDREPKTIVNRIPIGDSIILKRTTRHSGIAIIGTKTEEQLFGKDPELVSLEVVAYGNLTYTIEIGDKVDIDFTSSLQEVKIYTKRNYDIIKKQLLNPDVKLTNADTFEIDKYYRVSMYSIYAIIKQ
jgi:hypothetical protein